jgi:hypothetical protein
MDPVKRGPHGFAVVGSRIDLEADNRLVIASYARSKLGVGHFLQTPLNRAG